MQEERRFNPGVPVKEPPTDVDNKPLDPSDDEEIEEPDEDEEEIEDSESE